MVEFVPRGTKRIGMDGGRRVPERGGQSGKRRMSRAQRRRLRRQKRIVGGALAALALLLLAAIVWMLVAGGNRPADDASGQRAMPMATVAVTAEIVATAELTSAPEPAAIATAEPIATPEPTATPEPERQYITLTAVGDCTLGGNTKGNAEGEKRFAKCFEQNGADYFFQDVRALFESDDVTVANLEGPLTTARDRRSNRQFNFRGDPEYVQILAGSGVEVCNVANNHAYDFETAGFEETAQTLADAGIGACGFGLEHYMEIKGCMVGLLGFTEWNYEQDELLRDVRNAREKCDLLIVSIHWGEELTHKHTKTTEKLGRAMVDAGADLVIGNHSHVYGEIEQYNGKYIIYSLGNFCFGGNKRPTDPQCIIFQQRFEVQPGGGAVDAGINLIPAQVSTSAKSNDYQPVLLEGGEGAELLAKVAKVSNLTAENTIWMPESYVVENQIVTTDAKIGPAATPAGT